MHIAYLYVSRYGCVNTMHGTTTILNSRDGDP
jgi:hypothetical protein